MEPLRIGVSACLLGREVRWDGGHKRHDWVVDHLAERAELIPFCPEVELGLGVPREPIDVVGGRLIGRSGADHTAAMGALGARRARELSEAGISAYVFKSRSPSCDVGRGMFAAAIAGAIEGLPLIDEVGLADPAARRQLAIRAAAFDRASRLFGHPWRRGELVEHHAREKLLVMAHSPAGYRELGALVARVAQLEPVALAQRYRRSLMDALAAPPAVGRHVNALQHIVGYFTGDERARAARAVDRYAAGAIELAEVQAGLLAAARRAGHDDLAAQTYLAPPPW